MVTTRAGLARCALLAAALLVAATAARADPGRADREGAGESPAGRAWYVPDHAAAQLAGNTGFVAAGVGYATARERLFTDVLLGWVPEAVGGLDIFSLTAKLGWAPWKLERGSWILRPLVTGAQLTYTFGSQYFAWQPDRYPKHYYPRPTAFHLALTIGGAVTTPLELLDRRVAMFAELVALDHVLRLWYLNPRTVGPLDVFSLAFGARVAL